MASVMRIQGAVDKKPEASARRKIQARLGKSLSALGFNRTKTSFYTRNQGFVIEFIHLHTFSYAPGFRVHLGVRVLNDPFEAAALNGPYSPDSWFAFDSTPESIDHCVAEITNFCKETGEPWFIRWRDTDALLDSIDSPLNDAAKNALQEAINGVQRDEHVARSHELLGTA